MNEFLIVTGQGNNKYIESWEKSHLKRRPVQKALKENKSTPQEKID